MSAFRETGSEVQWDGKMFQAGVARFRFDDGDEVSREKVWHPGAVGVIALDDEHVWLTRQPREAIGAVASLEIPAGKLDVEGEQPLHTAQRELGEEIGKAAAAWQEIKVFYTSPGFSDERVWLYLATDLREDPDSHPDERERIEIVPWPLGDLERAISESEDSKTLIALLWLARQRAAGAL